MPTKEIQSALIEVFKSSGKPKAIRVDNGLSFVNSPTNVPTPICLWLIGIGIRVIQNRPRQPTDNAKVERMQGLTARWAEPQKCAMLHQLNEALQMACLIQREQYKCDRLNG